ncbi:3-dehydroquinate synthase [Deinococcus soli (ex Cha et al. 2016)]|uniref:3-dehydroquinate synthase n=1 Tax=Deinococcus soli (ex Cha et al. 2016) TaxID=1309411 RepID=A0A0F7JK64_9DEIO|nr:3-dehydroquinate synthase [Deinococcus soli (ex Cha et al. 2016)]AKH16536.1 3-dehydroquinate synthase [Deinococcus soli (ex Cha et al. 2016)]
MRRIEVGGAQSYAVEVGAGLLDTLRVPERHVALIHPTDLPAGFVTRVQKALQPAVTIPVPARDDCKTLEVLSGVLSRLAGANIPRDGAVVGLGGGAATDLAGFAAASYLRGVAFYTLPTTLLGMVDAAVGGKTGVNLPEGKNLVGAFWPPRAVWCDTDTLGTLPGAVFREGAAEAFKHGLISDPTLLDRVLSPDFRPGGALLEGTLADAIDVKAGVVTRDLTERGERAFLNFGHTLAHALEAVTHHGVPHGDAVGYGMHYAARLSRALGGADLTGHTRAFLTWQQPAPLPPVSFEDALTFMARDKKADADGVRFVLLRDLAQPYLTRVPEDVLREEFSGWQQDLHDLNLLT